MEKEKKKKEGWCTRRRSAQPPITGCQRRQAVIRRLNSRSSRSVFVRNNGENIGDVTDRTSRARRLKITYVTSHLY
ncbi:hypothetical protein PUN28_009204 [Cardiocondyla obscurior]|uniref:Uncharacterized protein n=1 Tax=Cardiocondyla obscurior TaxID=286306 RepID=A0AAW2FWH2_9HYME